MRQLTRAVLCYRLLLGTLAFTLPVTAASHDPGKTSTSWLIRDGGDVLRPDRASGDYHWFVGLDAGLTYSMFTDGPLAYSTINPHNSRYYLPAFVNEGSGLGFYFGATADFPVSDWIGVMLKANYHTRTGSFDEAFDLGEVHPLTETGLSTIIQNQTDWTFTYFGFDILLRLGLGDSGVYFIVGPSLGALLSNSAALEQSIVQPEDIYYTENVFGEDRIENFYRNVSSTDEIAGFADTRLDIKFGIGWRYDLSETLQLVPELSLAYPVSSFVDVIDQERQLIVSPLEVVEPPLISDWGNILTEQTYVSTNPDFNMTTVFFTLGLRWRIGS